MSTLAVLLAVSTISVALTACVCARLHAGDRAVLLAALAERTAERDAALTNLATVSSACESARAACTSWMDRADRFEQELHDRRPAVNSRRGQA